MGNMVDGCEILHQLIDGKHPITLFGFQHVSTVLLVMDFATIHSIIHLPHYLFTIIYHHLPLSTIINHY